MIKKPGTDIPGKKDLFINIQKATLKRLQKESMKLLNALYLSVQETIGYVDRENSSCIFHFITFFL